ncbi:alpha/beta-hydrolase [Guyanagaster necrorhizus]|uniref:Carboxylic ester hydrolase n=1 Tax=Guyanagaster necrorhizus TaxID=856835 RepID=A0A9P8AV09_9AGAR|nr:alpha/beta-hydrolase [Guyanagaster necrorhizus MCA 3950]KAG7448820.1 alpha/beta-hydrolase [Guyanagaster necrorhizus MCA 3950]
MPALVQLLGWCFLLQLSLSFSLVKGDPTANLSYGTFQGYYSGNLSIFLGIPFASPPLGSLRFAPPQAPAEVGGIQNASSFGPACPQQLSTIPDVLPFAFSMATASNVSEDCLTVNVWVPTNASKPLPVVMPPGGFETGYTEAYDASDFVERSLILNEPVVFVSANYRVNAFGFLGGKEIQDAGLSNVGLRDQRFAMQWIQSYISVFGGDPTRVILWGESAGAISVGLHLLYNGGTTDGLFRGVFMQSGAPWTTRNISYGQPSFDRIAQETGCNTSESVIDCLRDVPYDTLMAAINTNPSVFNYTSLNLAFQPYNDGSILDRNAQMAVQQGRFAHVPFVTGSCADEGTVFSLGSTNITTDPEFMGYVNTMYLPELSSERMSDVRTAYPDDPADGSPFGSGDNYTLTPEYKRIAAFNGDYSFQAPRRNFLSIASQTQPAWAYLYTRGNTTAYLGAYHGSDLTEFFSFGGSASGNDFIGTDALVNFATNLDPNYSSNSTGRGVSLLETTSWSQWTSTQRNIAEFIDSSSLLTFTTDTYRATAMQLLTNLSLQV